MAGTANACLGTLFIYQLSAIYHIVTSVFTVEMTLALPASLHD